MKFTSKALQLTSVAALSLALALTGCSTGTEPAAGTASTSASASASDSASNSSAGIITVSNISDSTHFDDDDLNWDAATETAVTLAGDATKASGTNAANVTTAGSTVTINAGGTYRLSGALADGRVVVAAGEDVVRLVLDNASITSSTGTGLDIQSANEVLIYLADGTTNTVTDATSYTDTGTDAPNAAIYSKADLTIAGAGTLTVNGNYQDGITTKDGLVLASGNVTVNAVDDGIKGKDYTVLLNGSYSVTAGGDGIKSTNDTDTDRGWLLMTGGNLTVAAGDDGIKAATTLDIRAGNATVTTSEEAIEAAHILISGGTIDVTANDDGINASGGSSETSTATGTNGAGTDMGMGSTPDDMPQPQADGSTGDRPADSGTMDAPPAGGMGGGGGDAVGDYSVDISGGTVTINSSGDGLDSNGNASISGGTVVVNGPTNNGNGALDVNGELLISGGTLAAAGSSGMAVAPSTGSTQSGIQATFSTTVPAGQAIHIVDSAGTAVATFVPTKDMNSLVFSSQKITAGEIYTVHTGGTADVSAGLGSGSLTGSTEALTVTAGEYTAGRGPGRN